jgi:hypothetical protein
MTDISAVPAKPAKKPEPDDAGLDLVSGYKLAAHLGISRQGVDTLAAQGVLKRRADGLFDQAASRLAYLRHLKIERRGSTNTVAHAEYAKQKARLLELRIRREMGELMPTAEHDAFVDELVGLFLTGLSGFAARRGGRELAVRREIDKAVYGLRLEISQAASRMADQCGEPAAPRRPR